MNKPLLIFDFDGTIVDSITLGLKLSNQMAKKYKYDTVDSIEEIRALSGINFIKKHVKWYYLPFWLYSLKKEILNHLNEIKLYPNIKDVLLELKTDFELGIIGGGSKLYHQELVRILDLNFFSFIYSNLAYKKEKMIRKIIRKNKQKKIIMIGDDVADIRSAKRAGVKTIAVSWGTTNSSLLKELNPDALVEHPEQLHEAILNII